MKNNAQNRYREFKNTRPLSFRQRHMIYLLRRLGNTPWYMPMGREYDPLGQDRRQVKNHEHLDPFEYAWRGGLMVRLTPGEARRLRSKIHPRKREDVDLGEIYLYNDCCRPDVNREYWKYYSEALRYLMNANWSDDVRYERDFENTVNGMQDEQFTQEQHACRSNA